MTPEELTQFVNTQQMVLTRHDAEMAEIRAALLQSAQRHSDHEATMQRIDERIEATARQQEINAQQIALNREDIAELKASITDLRNIVADYIQGRSQT